MTRKCVDPGLDGRSEEQAGASMLQPKESGRAGGVAWLYKWSPLLYSFFFLPTHKLSPAGWAVYGLFYGTFLLAYLQAYRQKGHQPRLWLGVLFLIGYVYFPFNWDAAGEFVFPVVMSVFFLRQPKASQAFLRLLVIEAASVGGFFVECYLCHAPMRIAETIAFYMMALGLTNFAYARHVVASEQLERANAEIEHLAQVAERERIARDLHDLLGHTLTLIVLKSDLANRLFTADPEMAHREIAEVEATARKALAEVREAVAGYRSEGLPAEIAQARRTLASAGVQLTTHVEPMVFGAAVNDVLCLVLREAVTNVIRHAEATACRLELHRDGERLRLVVEDNGKGSNSPEGNGLRGMRERVIAAGGALQRGPGTVGGLRLVIELAMSANGPQREPLPSEGSSSGSLPAPALSSGQDLVRA